MLRTLVLGLGAANIAFFAWSQGWLGDIAGISRAGGAAATGGDVDEIDLGFLPAVGRSRGVEREILIYTIGKGIA